MGFPKTRCCVPLVYNSLNLVDLCFKTILLLFNANSELKSLNNSGSAFLILLSTVELIAQKKAIRTLAGK